jgi:hypothetical protein
MFSNTKGQNGIVGRVEGREGMRRGVPEADVIGYCSQSQASL